MALAERTETLDRLVMVTFRRIGQNRVHAALVMPESIEARQSFGVPCSVIAEPVAAWCGRTLRGPKVVIPDKHLDGWREQGHLCRECVLHARVALAQVESR
jgi:hypothetical protein